MDVETKTWTHHSNVNTGNEWPTCGFVTKKTGARWILCVLGSPQGSYPLTYFDLTNNSGWHTEGRMFSSSFVQYYMQMVNLHEYSALLLGSYNNYYSTSLRNFFEYDPDGNSFHYGRYYLRYTMSQAMWTTVPKHKNYRALQNCVATRRYVAVGWGGSHNTDLTYFPTAWTVLLRSMNASGLGYRYPHSCHGMIPYFSPGRFGPGVTAVDYRLMICGGCSSGTCGNTTLSSCYYLDTNTYEPRWITMPNMPVKRWRFFFITYGAAAFALGGRGENGDYLKRVDMWTNGRGWNEVSELPTEPNGFCAVADEGYDRIYVLGGVQTKAVFYLSVSDGTWHNIPPMQTSLARGACAIINRKDGTRILYAMGVEGGRKYGRSLNLNIMKRWDGMKTPPHEHRHSIIVSLTPYESYLVSRGEREQQN